MNDLILEKKIVEFLADNKGMIVFIGDPKNSLIVAGYKEKIVAKQIKDDKGEIENVVAQALIAGNAGGQARFNLSQMFSAMLHGFARTIEDTKIIKQLAGKRKGRKTVKLLK